MNPSFVLLHAESINVNKDSVCRIILIPVADGVRQTPKEFLVNPKSSYEMVPSGLSKAQVESAPDFESVWPKIQDILEDAPMVVCSAEGNSVVTIMGTVRRLGLQCPEIQYINAKAICRRTMDHFSYHLQVLADHYFSKEISYLLPVDIAETWAELAIIGLKSAPEEDFNSFAKAHHIRIGQFSSLEIYPSRCIQVKHNNFNPESIDVNADTEHPFYGQNVVFTGKMERMTRNEARAAVIAIGGIAPDRLTMETNFLVVGQQDLRIVGAKGLSGKMKKAAEYKGKGCDIEVIDENDFIEMLNTKP